MRPSDTWVCVADGTRAHFYRGDDRCSELEPVLGYGLASHCGGSPFADRVACQLDRAAGESRFEHLVLVGPLDLLRQVEDRLDSRTRGKVVCEVDKLLTHPTPRELVTHLCGLVRGAV